MKLQYFLDTDTVIYIKNHHPPQVLERFSVLKPGAVGISVITYGELIRGAERSDYKQRNHQKLKQIIEIIPVHSMPQDTGLHYGEIRFDLEKSGRIIGNNDLWIAAHARAMGVTVVTNNTKEFCRVENLSIENWV
jgi:tRNA(fMet)-specific endonuclease VapC